MWKYIKFKRSTDRPENYFACYHIIKILPFVFFQEILSKMLNLLRYVLKSLIT